VARRAALVSVLTTAAGARPSRCSNSSLRGDLEGGKGAAYGETCILPASDMYGTC